MSDKVFSLHLSHVKWFLVLSYFVALVLDSMITLSFNLNFIPSFTLLILLFWSTQILNQTHLFTAFLLGLLTDASLQTALGAHGLIFLSITFLMLRARLRFKGYPLWQQSLIITMYFFIYQIVSWVLFQPALSDNAFIYYWVEPIIAGLLWPLISGFMHSLTHRTVFN